MNNNRVAFITLVDSKKIERANGQSFDLWQVHDHENNVWVVKKPLADFARTLVGQQVTLVTRTEQKGNFTNFYAEAIYPQGQQIPVTGVTQQEAILGYDPNVMPQGQMPGGMTSTQQAPPQAQYLPQPMPAHPQYLPAPMPPQAPVSPSPASGGSAEHDRLQKLSINRSVALKAAASIAGNDLYVMWTLLPDMMAFLEHGVLPASIEQALNPASVASAASAPAANGEGASGGGMLPDDVDIPF